MAKPSSTMTKLVWTAWIVLWSNMLLVSVDQKIARASPVKFMCDLCESNWMHCMMNCHMEAYMTRHQYNDNDVYVGRPDVKPKKTKLDKMIEHFMQGSKRRYKK